MTTVTMDRTTQPVGALGRIWAVVKLNLANPWTAIVMPWMILGIIFVANFAIWAIIAAAVNSADDRADAAQGMSWSGASMFIFVYMMVVAIQTINLTFPFALGYGVTRRDFYLGSALTFVLLAAMFSIGLAVLGAIEIATNGWGLGGVMFNAAYFGDGPWFEKLWIFFTAFLFFLFVGSVAAALYVRWKANGMIFFFAGLGLLLIGVAALFTLTNNWPAFANFFAVSGFVGTYTWSLVLTVIAGVSGFFVLRRATPKN